MLARVEGASVEEVGTLSATLQGELAELEDVGLEGALDELLLVGKELLLLGVGLSGLQHLGDSSLDGGVQVEGLLVRILGAGDAARDGDDDTLAIGSQTSFDGLLQVATLSANARSEDPDVGSSGTSATKGLECERLQRGNTSMSVAPTTMPTFHSSAFLAMAS